MQRIIVRVKVFCYPHCMIRLARLKPIFTINQLKRLSNIFDNAGQVIFGIATLIMAYPGPKKLK